MKIKLWQKLLVLVLAPLLVNLFWIYRLYALRQDAATAAKSAHNESEILYSMNVVFLSLSNAAGQLAGYAIKQDKRQLEKSHTQLKLASDEYDQIKELTRGDLGKLQRTAAIRALIVEGIDALSAMDKKFQNADSFALMEQVRQLRPLLQKASDLEQRLLDAMKDELVEQKNADLKKLALEQQEQQSIQLGISINAILAALFFMVFSRDVTNRINVLVDNSRRFAQGLALLPRKSGSDELSELDDSFRAMAVQIAEAVDRRRSLMAMVAHDLRAPLMSTQVSLNLLEVGALGQLEEAAREEVTICEHNTARIICLINELLDIEKSESGRLELSLCLTKSSHIVKSAVDSVAAFARLRKIQILEPEDDFPVVCDADRLVQVLVNLLSNALKFSPEGTTVAIDVKESDDNLTFSVADEGPGLTPESVAKLGAKYQDFGNISDSRFRGSGLGLYICQWIVKTHGGELGVDTSTGAGAKFWFSLSAVREE